MKIENSNDVRSFTARTSISHQKMRAVVPILMPKYNSKISEGADGAECLKSMYSWSPFRLGLGCLYLTYFLSLAV